MEFMHIGVPTKTKQEGEVYVDGLKVHITQPDTHDYKFEYLRFEPGSCMPAAIQVEPHVAIKVESIQDELKKCQEVLVEPMPVDENLTICFARRDGVIFELMQMK